VTASRANDALRSIGVKVEGGGGAAAARPGFDAYTLNVMPLLHEVRHALARLVETGERTTIDLSSIPLAPGELDKIDEALGRGEVTISIEALGPSEIYETAFPGVWRITHHNAIGECVGRYVEIARVPMLVETQEEDLHASFASLGVKLSNESARA